MINCTLRFWQLWFVLWGMIGATTFCFDLPSLTAKEQRPNIVLIMTDNHGAWTLGCYGNRDIRTPHIDRLASEGTRFTRAFASNPVCSPTRATFLTGLIPSQHGVHSFLVGGRLQTGPEARCTLDQFTSLPEILQNEGYACGLVGKWHLGGNLNPQEAFDDYWITMPHGGTSTFYNASIIDKGKIRQEPKYLTEFWTDHAVDFIEQQANQEQPFFLFLAYNGPYSLGRLLLREGQNRHAAYYADKELPSFPREPTHPWQYSNRDYSNNPQSIRRVATEVSGVDDGVGRVMETLKKQKLDERTLVIFVADQGWVGGHGGFFGMGDHTRPLTARDGMMQIPMIWRHPNGIVANQKTDIMVTNYDFLPTLLSYLNLGNKMPKKPVSPGRDFARVLAGQKFKEWDNTAFYEFENLRCIRTDDWKYIHRHPNGPHELYNLIEDPNEFNNLANDASESKTRQKLKDRLHQFYNRHAEPKFDLWKGGSAQTRLFAGISEEIKDRSPTEPPPLPSNFQSPKIKVPKGYEVELVAGPPLVTHPTMGCFDDRGRLFVCNNAGVNLSAKELEDQRPNSIRLLEDTDKDGRFDRSKVFADKMTYPMGAAWHDGALYVASPPNIWRLEDTDDDGVADKREILVSQFGYTGNAASIHGCFKGPDGRMYWCDGYHGHEFRDETGKVTSQREGSYLFSCRPDGSDVRLHCGGGMDNPVEVDFTDEGEVLGTVNIFYTRPRVDCFVHWLHGGAYPHRERVLKEIKTTGELLGPVHRFGHVAVSGSMRYSSGVMDHRWRNNHFVTFFNSGKVVRLELAREGSSYRATQREFLSCDSPDFHPTDVLEDADGSLLIIDTGGWFYRGCPTSQHAKPEILGAIYRIRRKGMTPLVDPWGQQMDWARLTNEQLARHLNDSRFKVRERAIDECINRAETIVPTLLRALQRRDIRERLGSVWAFTRMLSERVGPESEIHKAIRLALNDRHPSVRQAATRSLSTYVDPAALPQLVSLMKQDQPSIRREAAKALGQLGDSKVIPALFERLTADLDRAEEHAVIYALIEINNTERTMTGLMHDSPRVKRAAIIAAQQIDPGGLKLSDLSPLLDANDDALRYTVLKSYERHTNDPVWATSAANQIQQWLSKEALAKGRSITIEKLLIAFAHQESVAKVVGETLQEKETTEVKRALLLDALARGNQLPLHPSWITPLSDGLRSENRERVLETIAAVSAIKTDLFRKDLQKIGEDSSNDPLLRVLAIEAASGRDNRLNDSTFALLLEMIRRVGDSQERTRAVQLLASASLSKPQLISLASALPKAGPVEIRSLVPPFQRNADGEVATAFLKAMEESRSLMSIPPNELSDVIKRYPAELRDRANALLDRLKRDKQERLNRLDRLVAQLDSGDADRGRVLFFSKKTKCATCHRVGEKGGKIGPDLTTIGSNRSRVDLLESIVFPSATLVRDYQAYSVLTTEGQTLTGLITRDTGEEITLQPQLGEPVRLARKAIETMQPSTVSIMPNGLEKALTETELADVVAYLRSLRPRKHVVDSKSNRSGRKR